MTSIDLKQIHLFNHNFQGLEVYLALMLAFVYEILWYDEFLLLYVVFQKNR